MNIHFVALRRRDNFQQRLLAAANSVSYRIGTSDRIFVYSNLCLDSRDIGLLRSEFGCEVHLQPLSANEDIALSSLSDVVTANARFYANEANMLVDNDGICKRNRVTVIPAYASRFKF